MATLANVHVPLWHVSIEKYHAMIESGILGPEDRVELLEGVLVEKMSKKPAHTYASGALLDALFKLLPAGFHVRDQDPITMGRSEPEPDIAVVRGSRRDYLNRHPGPSDVLLIIEIADMSLERDRILKQRIYAAAGIPCYWILDLAGRRLEVCLDPRDGAYSRWDIYRAGDAAPVILDGVEAGSVAVTALLP